MKHFRDLTKKLAIFSNSAIVLKSMTLFILGRKRLLLQNPFLYELFLMLLQLLMLLLLLLMMMLLLLLLMLDAKKDCFEGKRAICDMMNGLDNNILDLRIMVAIWPHIWPNQIYCCQKISELRFGFSSFLNHRAEVKLSFVWS